MSLCYTSAETVPFMAPEIVDDPSAYGHGADVWAMGVILYIMLMAVPPFEAAGGDAASRRARTFQNIHDFQYRPIGPHISQDAAALIKKVLLYRRRLKLLQFVLPMTTTTREQTV